MKKKGILFLTSFIIACAAPVADTGAGILYKKYVVSRYGGFEILCEPYRIKKDDSVIRLLRDKGDISANDFPEFLSIFRTLNPRVSDINLIRENDEILIPLKKLSPDSLPGQSSGIVTIPFVSVSSSDEIFEQHTEEYKVKEGDSISGIVDSFFKPSGNDEKKQGFELVKLLNPGISDLNRIGAGTTITVPKQSIRSQPGYMDLFDRRGKPNPVKAVTIQKKEDRPTVTNPGPMAAPPKPMEKFASLVEGRIYKTGQYFIPKPDGSVQKIDLSRDPMLDIEGGGKVLFSSEYESMPESDKAAIKKAMPDTSIIDGKNTSTIDGVISSMASASVLRKPPAPIILGSENAVIEIMPEWLLAPGRKDPEKKVFVTQVKDGTKKSHAFLLDYLKHARGVLLKEVGSSLLNDKKDIGRDYFIDETETINFSQQDQLYANLASAMGYSYSENAVHSVAASEGNLEIKADTIYSSGGQIFILADRDMKREDIAILRNSGIKVIEMTGIDVNETDYSDAAISNFLEMLGCTTEINPTLKILSNRSGEPYVTIRPTGIYAKTPEGSEFMVTKGAFSTPVTATLQNAGIKTVHLVYNSYY